MKPIVERLRLTGPTLLVDRKRAQQNIACMAEKASRSGVRLRPHFKTHQAAQVGEWYRDAGVSAITVSSVSMAQYFAHHGWHDITVAIPVNLREIETINALAEQVSLHLLVESPEAVRFLGERLHAPASVWLKIDTGYHRTGMLHNEIDSICRVAAEIGKAGKLRFRGLLTHAGHTYKAKSRREVKAIYAETLDRLQQVRQVLADRLQLAAEISVGDTPGCTTVESFGAVDEIRPGNFVFFDAMQMVHGICGAEHIALAVACPVLAKHASRQEIVLYGGAVHLSKESVLLENGETCFGLIALPETAGWSAPVASAYVASVSQEHGIVKAGPELFRRVQIGDFLIVLPAHSCLAANLLKQYVTLDGERFAAGP